MTSYMFQLTVAEGQLGRLREEMTASAMSPLQQLTRGET